MKPATGDEQQATGNADPQATTNRQQAAGNRQLTHSGAPEMETDGRLARGANLADRLLGLAVTVVRVMRSLPRDQSTRHIGQQLIRSITAMGANYEEARGAESRADFIHKLAIALKESRESIYWLRLVSRLDAAGSKSLALALASPIRECIELASIFGASIRTARSRE